MAIDPSNILLTGRVAVVTGGGEGIGRGIAEGLAAFGAKVAIWERDPDTCASAAESHRRAGHRRPMSATAEQVDAALERTADELGTVSILVNNAGGVFASALLETTENGWDALYKSQPSPCPALHAAGGAAPGGRGTARKHHQRDVDRGGARGTRLRRLRRRQGRRHQLHQDGGARTGDPGNPGQRAGPRPHRDRRVCCGCRRTGCPTAPGT